MVRGGCTSSGSSNEAELVQQLFDLITIILLLQGQLHVVGVDITRSGITLDVGGPALQLDVDVITKVRL